MRFTVSRENLLKALQIVVGVIERRQTIPILSHVWISLSSQALKLMGTNNEITIMSTSAVNQTIQEGVTTVPAHTLFEICNRFPEGALLSCMQEKDQFTIEFDKIRFQLLSLPAQDFPSSSFSTSASRFEVKANSLLKALKKTAFAVAQQDARQYLNGMLWSIQEGQLRLLASNGHILASKTIAIGSDQNKSVIVPRKMIAELSRLLGDVEEKVVISMTDHHIEIKDTHYHIISGLLSGSFPDYKQLLPDPSMVQTAVIERDHLKSALHRQSALMKNIDYKGIQLQLSENLLKLVVSNRNLGYGEEQFPIQYTPKNQELFSIAFSIDYLDKILDVLSPGLINLILPLHEGVTLIEQFNNQDHLYMIMPMLLGSK